MTYSASRVHPGQAASPSQCNHIWNELISHISTWSLSTTEVMLDVPNATVGCSPTKQHTRATPLSGIQHTWCQNPTLLTVGDRPAEGAPCTFLANSGSGGRGLSCNRWTTSSNPRFVHLTHFGVMSLGKTFYLCLYWSEGPVVQIEW